MGVVVLYILFLLKLPGEFSLSPPHTPDYRVFGKGHFSSSISITLACLPSDFIISSANYAVPT